MAKKMTREELATAFMDLYLELEHLKTTMSHYAEPMIERHNARAFKQMRKKI